MEWTEKEGTSYRHQDDLDNRHHDYRHHDDLDDRHHDYHHQDSDDEYSDDQYDSQYLDTADTERLYLQKIIECGWTQYCKVVEDLRVVSEEKCDWIPEQQKLIRAEKRHRRKLQRRQCLLEQKEAALNKQTSRISDLEQEVRVLAEQTYSCKKANFDLGSCLRQEREKVKQLELQLTDKKTDVMSLQYQIRHLTKKQDELAEENQALICSENFWQDKTEVLQEILIQQSTSFGSQVDEMSCKQSALLLKLESLQEDSEQEKVKWEEEKKALEARCLQLEAIMADKDAMKKEIKRREEEKKKQEEEEIKKREKEEKKKKRQEEEEMKKREKEEKKKKRQEEEEMKKREKEEKKKKRQEEEEMKKKEKEELKKKKQEEKEMKKREKEELKKKKQEEKEMKKREKADKKKK
ncbi:uncharacterized protein V6R79_018125 [Siganus canaliculatus]